MRSMRARPSRAQSVIGFIVGIFFIIIGLTTVVHLGLFGVVWTIMAILITGFHGVNAFTKKGLSTMTIEETSNSDNVEARLKKLESLREQRLITSEEYDVKKQSILNDL